MSEDTNLLPQVTEEKSGRSVVQQLVKEVTIGVAVVYAIGMLTTNVYLSRLVLQISTSFGLNASSLGAGQRCSCWPAVALLSRSTDSKTEKLQRND
jgi:hypothetical protein